MHEQNYYELLDVQQSATQADIKSAYLELIKVWHPDRFATDQKLHDRAQEMTKSLNEAYSVLSSPAKRKDYDATLKATAQHTTSASGSRSKPDIAPPDIRVSVTSLDFGTVTKGQSKKLSFTVTNSGGPVNTYDIGWTGSPDWVEAEMRATGANKFPVTVTLTLSATAPVGDYEDTIIVGANGKLFAEVPVIAKIKAVPKASATTSPTPKAKPAPVHRPATRAAPKATHSKSSTATTVAVTAGGIGLFGIFVAIAVVVIIGALYIQSSNQQYQAQIDQSVAIREQKEDAYTLIKATNVTLVPATDGDMCSHAIFSKPGIYCEPEWYFLMTTLVNDSPYQMEITGDCWTRDQLVSGYTDSQDSYFTPLDMPPHTSLFIFCEYNPDVNGPETIYLNVSVYFEEDSHLLNGGHHGGRFYLYTGVYN